MSKRFGKPKNGVISPENKVLARGKVHDDTPAARRQRKELIEWTVQDFNQLYPDYMQTCRDYLEQVTKVQTREWRTGKGWGELKLQLPQLLFTTLRVIFGKVLPDEPKFGDIESDIELLMEVAPRLVPPIGGARANRGKAAR